MPRAKRNYRPLLALSVASYALLAGAGMVHSIRTVGHPPHFAAHYSAYIDGLLAEGDTGGALAQLRLAAEIDSIDPQAVAALTRLARQTGDLDSEIFALRLVQRRNPLDVGAHNAVAEALLRQRPVGAGGAEQVVQHSEIALRLDPRSALAHEHLGAAWEVLGRDDLAAEHRREARRLSRVAGAAPGSQAPGGQP